MTRRNGLRATRTLLAQAGITIRSSGVRRVGVLTRALGLAVLVSARAVVAGDVLTYKNDNARTGQQLHETALTPDTVNVAAFGKLFSYPVDGATYSQPLVMSAVVVPGKGTYDVVFVATEHDSVYAFDAAGVEAEPLWHVSFLDNPPPGVVVSTVPSADVGTDDIAPEIGITSTPVIDPATGTLYVEALTKEESADGPRYVHRLHALDVSTGAEKLGGPVVISAVVTGTGSGADAKGHVYFDPLWEFNRPALLLSGGVVYIAFGAHADTLPSHGWILGYDAGTLRQVATFNTTPDGSLGSVWMSGGGPAADAAGTIFVITANGTFDLASGGRDSGDSFLKLTPRRMGLLLSDYFTPFDQAILSSQDLDLGSGGVMLLPDTPGSQAHLAVGASKDGTIYLVNRNRLGGYSTTSDAVVQEVRGLLNGCFSTPAVLGERLFFGASDYNGGNLFALDRSGGVLAERPASQAGAYFGYPGVNPSVSADGSHGGIVWAIENASPAVLHAYLASDLGRELYSSSQAADGSDQPGDGVKFAVPTVWNGNVYVGTQTELAAYGLRSAGHLARKQLTEAPPPAGAAASTQPGGRR